MKFILLLSTITISVFTTVAQTESSFTLKQAQEYALKYNYQRVSAEKDVLIAKKKVMETTGIGLPQVTAEAQFQNFLALPVSLVPASAFNPLAPKDEFAELKFGTDYNTTAKITATQLLFDGSYIVGLQASRTYKSLTEKSLEKTELTVREEVAQAYYLCLVADENVKILSEIVTSTEKLYEETQRIYQEGFMEEQNVDQLRLTLNNINNSLTESKRQKEIALNLLKFQMGMELVTTITLTDNIDVLLVAVNPADALAKEFKAENHIENQIIKVNEDLMKLNLRKEKYAFAPQVAAFFNHQQQNMSNKFEVFSGGTWYPSTLWGLSIKLPIISGGMRLAKVGQARLDYEKAKNTSKQVEQSLLLKAQQAKSNYTSSYSIYLNQKDGLQIAEKINNNSMKKYTEGIISSMELTQSQTQYLETEAKYIKSLLDLLNASSQLNIALGKNQ
ncbi:MAG: TolC family protein [Flavobacteriales bacterium]|nr:TolC family protein [Flavobacteriales bacterium]